MSADAANLFPPPRDAISLYVGPVMHTRLKPVYHRFNYRVFSILIDLGALKAGSRLSKLFAVNRFNVMSFYEKDHGPRDGTPLLSYALELFNKAGVNIDGGRVLLLCYPRIFGYVFDPLSVYFGYCKDGNLRGVLYEVRNTFGEAHTYVEPVTDGQLSVSGLRQEREKLFYVSPFNPLTMYYFFRIRPPVSTVALRILVKDQTGPIMSASFHGYKQKFTSKTITLQCLSIPFMTLKIMVGIHWEALWLWVKGMRLITRPLPPAKVSFPAVSAEHSAKNP